MKGLQGKKWLLAALLIGLLSTAAFADVINQNAEYNANGTPSTSLAGLNTSAWNSSTGLGTVTYTDTGTGSRFFDIFFDLQLGQNVFWNEYGTVNGTAPTGMSFQIDCPDYDCDANRTGNVEANMFANTLDNINHIPGTLSNFMFDCGADGGAAVNANCNNDVAAALGFSYLLDGTNKAVISINITQTAPTGGFYLAQFKPQDANPDSAAEAVYFVPTIDIVPNTATVPEPTTLALLGAGLLGVLGRKWLSKK